MSEFQPRYQDLVTLFNDSSTRNANRPLFGVKQNGTWNWLTYGDFARQVDQARAGLKQMGVEAGDRVAIISNNRVEWAAAAYASYGLGAAFVPMYEAQQDKEWKYILSDSGAKVVIGATSAIARRLKELQPSIPTLQRVICLDAPVSDGDSFAALLQKGAANPTPAVPADPKSIAGFIYTSGTTGNPKGVLLSHSNLANNVSAVLSVFPITADHRSLSFLPWAHSFGQTAELHTLIGAGASMAICEGIPHIIANLAEVQPTILMAVPNIFNKIYDAVHKKMAAKPAPIRALFATGMRAQTKAKNGESLSMGEKIALPVAKKIVFSKIVQQFGGRLQFAISGGAALSKEVGEFVDNLGILVFEGYGLTETSPVASCNTPTARRIGSIGKAIPGVTLKLDYEASGSGDEGEVIVYGHNVMQGYYNLPEESGKVFTEDGGFRTGDLGRSDKDGFIYITGRIKELYKLENGKYVAPAALESKLQLSPYILQAMIYGANRPFNVALIVPDPINIKEWAAAQGITETDIAKLNQNPKVRELVRDEIAKLSTEWKGYEKPKDFALLSKEFTVEDDLLTPKLSMKRRNIIKRYENDIEKLYAANGAAKVA